MTGTSSIGPVLDYLTGAGMIAALQTVNPNVDVLEGWDTSNALDRVIIGRADPGDSSVGVDGALVHMELGALHIDERYDVPCYIDVWRGGGIQSEPRNIALALFNAFVAYLQTDLSLGNAVNRFVEITQIRVFPTPDQEHANEGRRQVIAFAVTCKNKF